MRGQPVLDGRAVARRLSGSLRFHGAGTAPAVRFERRVRDAFKLLEQRPELGRALPRSRSPRQPSGVDAARRTTRMDRPAIPGA